MVADRNTRLGQIHALVYGMDREQLKWELANFRSRVRLDFTQAYLDSLSLDGLRHLVQAVLLEVPAA